MSSLLRSRKVMLALLGLVQSLVLHYLDVPPEVWMSVNALLVAVIGGVAYEDGQAKRAKGLIDLEKDDG